MMTNEEKILSMLDTVIHGQSETNQRLDKLEQDVSGLKQDVSDLKQSVVRIEKQDISDLKQSVVRIENEHGQKLDAVFDGYKLLYDISSAIRSDVATLKSTQDKHDLHIKWLDASKRKIM
jgi:predicted nuclease with TOPRIM domain